VDPAAASETPLAFQQHGVVIEGSINPAIFQPRWMASVGVIAFDDADAADPPLVSPGVTTFRTPRLSVQVTTDRAVFVTGGMELADLIGLVEKLLQLLPHTPITSVEIVHECHAPMNVSRWGALSPRFVVASTIEQVVPGAELVGLELERDDDDDSMLRVFVEPSGEVEGGTYLRVQREFVIDDVEQGSAGLACRLLNQHWTASLQTATNILGRLVEATP
jgi:hypothetical protein